jgi:hypothetical protein
MTDAAMLGWFCVFFFCSVPRTASHQLPAAAAAQPDPSALRGCLDASPWTTDHGPVEVGEAHPPSELVRTAPLAAVRR